MIILEGPDLGGKSTIANILVSVTGMRTHHFGGPPKSKEEITDRIKSAPSKVIFDRHPCISEQVYGHMQNRTPVLDTEYMDKLIMVYDPLIFYCNPGLSFLHSKMHFLKSKAHKSQEHVDFVRQNYDANYRRYEQVMAKLAKRGINIVKVHFQEVTAKFIEERLDEYYRYKG